MKIGDVSGKCAACGWSGTVSEMEPDDGTTDGELRCPECLLIIPNVGVE